MPLKVKPDDRFQELLPALEETLVRGTKGGRRRLSNYLRKVCEELTNEALALGRKGDLYEWRFDSRVWEKLEREGDLTSYLFTINQAVLYDYWSRHILNPNRFLRQDD